MSRGTDGVLAVLALGAFVGGLVVADAPVSIPLFVAGSLGTIAFEVVAVRHTELVHRYWDRPIVQAGTLAGSFVLVSVGIFVAPSSILSAGIGALVTYLTLLIAAVVG